MSDLHDRIAKALGWSASDVRSLSMQSLRDLVRPVDPDLTQEMDYVIQSGAYVRGTPASTGRGRQHHSVVQADPPKKSAKDIEAAVKAAQLYIGSALAAPIRDQQRLYNSMQRKIAAVAKRRGMDEYSTHEQIMNAAKSRGGITPTPGKDV